VEHAPPTECFHDSFRDPTVLAARDRNGDVSHPCPNGLSVAAGRQEQSRGRDVIALLQLSDSGRSCELNQGRDRGPLRTGAVARSALIS
jgi:hypothetical protein